MRFLRPVYLHIVGEDIGAVPEQSDFAQLLSKVSLSDEAFNIQTFPPGTSGEAKLFNLLNDDVFPDRRSERQGLLFD